MDAIFQKSVLMALVLMSQMKKWQNKNKMHSGRGGKREGAGRPPVPTGTARKMRSMRLSDEEYEQVKEFIKTLRNK